jgi:hypothetical protein
VQITDAGPRPPQTGAGAEDHMGRTSSACVRHTDHALSQFSLSSRRRPGDGRKPDRLLETHGRPYVFTVAPPGCG